METGSTQKKGKNLQLISQREAEENPAPEVFRPLRLPLSLTRMEEQLAQRERLIEEKEKQLNEVMATVQVAFKVLSGKTLVMLALLVASSLFIWSVFDPTGLRITAACLFTAIVFLPALYAEKFH